MFSKNPFAHEDPATINALMLASVESKFPTTVPQIVFTHHHLDLLLAVSLRNCPPTLTSFFCYRCHRLQVEFFVRRVARLQYFYVIQMSGLGPQLNSEAPMKSRPLLGSWTWTFLSRRIAPTIPFVPS